MPRPDPSREVTAREEARLFHWLVLLLCLGALFTLHPLWVPLVLAAWTAVATAPIVERATSPHRRRRAAAVATGVAVAILVPVGGMGLFVTNSVVDLYDRIRKAEDQWSALGGLLTTHENNQPLPTEIDLNTVLSALKDYGRGALNTANVVLGVTVHAVIGVTIFIVATYCFLISGKAIHKWLADHLPLPRGHFHRLSNAFVETGRGLFLGIGATALLQGVVAGIGFLILGISYAAVLGLFTAFAAIVPTFGTGLVWAPLAAGMFLAGKPGTAVGVLVIGAVIATADNFVRPVLARWGALRMPVFLVFLTMLGGLAAFGAWGVLLGPLLVRLAMEGLEIVSMVEPRH